MTCTIYGHAEISQPQVQMKLHAGCKSNKEPRTGSAVCGALHNLLAAQQRPISDLEVCRRSHLPDPWKPEDSDHWPFVLAMPAAEADAPPVDGIIITHDGRCHKPGDIYIPCMGSGSEEYHLSTLAS